MSRRTARKHIFNLIFQYEYNADETFQEIIDKYKEEYQSFESGDASFIISEFNGIIKNREVLDAEISKASVGWETGRMPKTDLAILRLGTYEILFADDIPDTVAINEAVELSKSFGDEKTPKFINGVLGTILKNKKG